MMKKTSMLLNGFSTFLSSKSFTAFYKKLLVQLVRNFHQLILALLLTCPQILVEIGG